MSHQPSDNSEPSDDHQICATAWSLQQRVNAWFRENESWREAKTDLIKLTERGPSDEFTQMKADPDGEWYQMDGRRPASRPQVQVLRDASFWSAVDPLYDFLHDRYQLAWTYSVLMFQSNENFRGTVLNLGVGDHFSARSEVIFANGEGSEVRAGWHVNQLPPFLVQQGLTFAPPFELISTYAINVRFLTDALPFTLTRAVEDDEASDRDHRVISVAPLYEVFGNDLSELIRLVESAGIHYTPEQGWGHGGVESLKPIFAELGRRLEAILTSAKAKKLRKANQGFLFKILREGPSPRVIADVQSRLSRPESSHRALAKYLVLMSAVWPDWTRIMMIPHPVPVLSHPQPGGIVICEDSRSKRLTAADTRQIAELLSIAIWPWVSLQGRARIAEESMHNAALLGEVVRHDLANSLSPVRVMLLRRKSRLEATDEECSKNLSRLDVLNRSIDGLCGLEDPPLTPERKGFGEMFTDLSNAFVGDPRARFSLQPKGELRTGVPRLYYAVFVELIRNAAKRRPVDWPQGQPSIIIKARQDGETLIVTVENVANDEDIKQACTVFKKSVRKLSEQAQMNLGGKSYRKGIGLVVSLVRHAHGSIDCKGKTDALGRRWLSVSIRIF